METMEERILAAIKQRQEEFKANLEYATAHTNPVMWHIVTLFGALHRPPLRAANICESQFCCRTVTLKKCRKVLEGDMGLGPGGLDNHKDHIRALIEKVSPRTIILRLWECTHVAPQPSSRMRQESYIGGCPKSMCPSADGGQLSARSPVCLTGIEATCTGT